MDANADGYTLTSNAVGKSTLQQTAEHASVETVWLRANSSNNHIGISGTGGTNPNYLIDAENGSDIIVVHPFFESSVQVNGGDGMDTLYVDATPAEVEFAGNSIQVGDTLIHKQSTVEHWLLLSGENIDDLFVQSGDFNSDGKVDHDDYRVWQSNFGRPNENIEGGDADGDGDADGNDFLAWQTGFARGKSENSSESPLQREHRPSMVSSSAGKPQMSKASAPIGARDQEFASWQSKPRQVQGALREDLLSPLLASRLRMVLQ